MVQIPASFIESRKLLSPDDSSAKAFSGEMQRILDRLLDNNPNYGKRRDDFKFDFRLSADSEIRGSTAKNLAPPVILFSKGLIDFVQSKAGMHGEAWLAAILVHEIAHNEVMRRTKKNQVGKPEEALADMMSIEILAAAGYPPTAMKEFLIALEELDKSGNISGPRDDLNGQLAIVMHDVHPKLGTRIIAVDGRLKSLEFSDAATSIKLGAEYAKAPVDPALVEAARKANYVSPLQKHMQKVGFDAADPKKKFELFREAQKEFLDGGKSSISPRYAEMETYGKRMIKSLVPLWQSETAGGAFAQEIEAWILELNQQLSMTSDQESMAKTLHAHMAQQFEQANPALWQKTDPVARAVSAYKDFVGASTEERISATAKELIERLDALDGDWKQPLLLPDAKITHFDMPSLKQVETLTSPIPLPWEPHIQAALKHSDQNVAYALKTLGVPEQGRLAGMDGFRKRSEYIKHPLNYESDGNLTDSTYVRDGRKQIILDEQHRISGLIDHSDQKQNQSRFHQARIAREKKALETVDWSLLEESGPLVDGGAAFFNRYRTLLTPPFSSQKTEYPFAQAVIAKLESLVQADPEKHRETVRTFLKNSDLNYGAEDARKAGIEVGSLKDNKNKIALDYPVMRFVLESDPALVNARTKMAWLEYASCFDGDYKGTGENPQKHWIFKHYDKVLPPLPGNADDFAEWLKINLFSNEHEGVAYMQHDSVRRYLDANKEPLSFHQAQKIINELSGGGTQGWFSKTQNLLMERAKPTLDALPKPNSSLETLTEEYKRLTAERNDTSAVHSIFSLSPGLMQRYDTALRSALEALPDTQSRYDAIHRLFEPSKVQLRASRSDHGDLRNGSLVYSGRIPSPQLRGWLTDQLALGFAETMGKDDETPAYAQKLADGISKLGKGLSPAVASDVLTRVSHARLDSREDTGNLMQLQRENAYRLAKAIDDIQLSDMGSYNLSAAIGESVVTMLDKKPDTREVALEFLTKPYSEAQARKTLAKLDDKVWWKDDKPKYLLTDESVPLSVKLTQMEQMHRNFWSASFLTRTAAARAILFGTDEWKDTPDNRKLVDVQLQQVLDTTFPDRSDSDSKYARLIITKYIANTADIEMRRMMVGALLTAGDPNERGTQRDTGRALKLVLDALGPAGRKLAQSIESASETPEDIRVSFRNSKTMAVQLRRDQIFSLVDQEGPQQGQEPTSRIGKVLGAGSYGVTAEFQRQPEDEFSALTMLYANVGKRAAKEFEVLRKTADDVAAEEKVFAPVKDMVRQAERMSEIEVDMDLAAKQAEVASKLYDGVKVTIGGKDYDFFSAPYLSHGKNYKEFKIIPGEHFNDLGHDTPAADKRRRDCAKAILTVELAHMFSGRPFDHDRHGGQQRIEDNRIGQFDFGALRTDSLSPREKQIIGHVIGGVLRGHFADKQPLHEVIRREIDKCADTPWEKDFICAMERGALALGNFTKALSEDEIKQVIGTVFTSKQIDPDILKAVEERLETGVAGDSIYKRVKKELESAAAKSDIKLTMPEREFDRSTDETPLKPAPDDSKLTMKHDKKAIIAEGGAGLLVTLAGFGWLYKVCQRINEKKKKGEEITWRDRIEQGVAATAPVLGAAAAIDAMTGARGMTKIGQYTRLILNHSKAGPREL